MTLNMPDYYRKHLVPHDELLARVRVFQKSLREAMLGGALLTHKTSLYYLAGTIQPAHLYIPAEGEPLLLVRRNKERIVLESPWQTTPLRSLRALPDTLKQHYALPERLGIELDVMPVLTLRRYQKALPDIEWHDVGRMLRSQRSVKSAWEIERIRAIKPLACKMLAAIPKLLKAGQTEVEFAGLLEGYARAYGHQGHSWLRGYSLDMYWGHLIAGASG